MTASPPRAAALLLQFVLPTNVSEPLLGDLHEQFELLATQSNVRHARRWYWRETFRALSSLTRIKEPAAPGPVNRGGGPMWNFIADVRFGARQLARRPAFTALVIGTLALGIGATTAIFSAIYPILFEPLPYPHAERLVMVSERGKDGASAGIGYATIEDIRTMNKSFESIAAITGWGPTLTGQAEPEVLNGENVSYTYFHVLGVAPALGRDFRAEEDVRGAGRVAILSNGLWRTRFGGDPGIINRTIVLNDTPFTVVGVMPADFENLAGPQSQIWTTLRYDTSLPYACRTCHHVRAIARLKPDVSPAQALVDLNTISARLVADHPAEYAAPGMLDPTLAEQVTTGVRPALLAVFGGVTLLLLIACANVTNLLLARGTQRVGEFSVRPALGAGRGRIVRQLLSESLVMTGVAAILGVGLAIAGVRGLVAAAPARLPRVNAIHVQGVALAFTLAISSIVGLVFGLVPAMQASRSDLYHNLKLVGRRSGGTRRTTRAALVVAEVALALILLVGSGLMLRTVVNVLGRSPGFDASNLLTMQVQTTGARFNDATVFNQYFDQVLTAVRAVPGVESAAATSQLPLSGDYDGYGVHIESQPNPNPETDPSAFRNAVTAGYLETMGIPLRSGRTLTPADNAAAPPVVVINEAFARRFWPNRNPIGERMRLGAAATGPWYTVVGVVGDVRQISLVAEQPLAIYLPESQWQFADGAMSVVVRSHGDPAAITAAVRRAIWSIDRNQPIVRVATMNTLVAATEAQRTFTLGLFATFAAIALLLAGAGIFGVLSGAVTERFAEIGVRSALGATRRSIVWLVVRQGMMLALLGVVVGIAGAAVATRLLDALLVDVPRLDAVTYVSVTLLLGGVAAAASWIPASRAAQIDPVITLRSE